MLAQVKSRIRGILNKIWGPRGFCRWERMGVGKGPLCLYPHTPQRRPWLWPKLEKAFGSLPFPAAAGTSGLVHLPRRALPEGVLFFYQAWKTKAERILATKAAWRHPTMLRIGPFRELGEGGRGAAAGLGQLVPSAKKQATEKWSTQLQHGASGGRGRYGVGGVNGRKRFSDSWEAGC